MKPLNFLGLLSLKSERYSEKFQLLLIFFHMVYNKLFSKPRMFWSKLCKWNWISAWNVAFPVFISPIVWNMCENLDCGSVYFKELHNDQEYYWLTMYRAGAAVESSITSRCLTNNVILIPCGCGWLHQRAQIIMLIGWGHTWGLNYFQFSYLNGQHEILNLCHGHDCHPCVQRNGICRKILRTL